MMRRQWLTVAGVVLTAGWLPAQAQMGYALRRLHVYAGPATTYPLVGALTAGAALQIAGCLEDWSWCDVVYGGSRGWAYAPNLSYFYQGSRVPLYNYAPRLGIPIVSFSVGNYWDQYYRGRPWYGQRNHWMHRPPPMHLRPNHPPFNRPPPGGMGRPGDGRPGAPGPGFNHRPGPNPGMNHRPGGPGPGSQGRPGGGSQGRPGPGPGAGPGKGQGPGQGSGAGSRPGGGDRPQGPPR